MTDDLRRQNALAEGLRILGEHFDHVQIMVSWCEQGACYSDYYGAGNWYARQGLAHEFIQKDIAQENARQLAGVMPQNPPDENYLS